MPLRRHYRRTLLDMPLGDLPPLLFDAAGEPVTPPEGARYVRVHEASLNRMGMVITGRPVRDPERAQPLYLALTADEEDLTAADCGSGEFALVFTDEHGREIAGARRCYVELQADEGDEDLTDAVSAAVTAAKVTGHCPNCALLAASLAQSQMALAAAMSAGHKDLFGGFGQRLRPIDVAPTAPTETKPEEDSPKALLEKAGTAFFEGAGKAAVDKLGTVVTGAFGAGGSK